MAPKKQPEKKQSAKRTPEPHSPAKKKPQPIPPRVETRTGLPRATPPTNPARAPNPQRAPSAPNGRETASEAQSIELVRAPLDLGSPYEETPNVAYPLFPNFAPGAIDGVRVYRTTARNDGVPGMAWTRIALPWVASLVTWDQIAQICGGGRYVVSAVSAGRTISNVTRTFEGLPRTPDARDVASISPGLGLAENGSPVYETPNGWISIPGLDPGAQAAFITLQQSCFYARDDAHKAISAMALLTGQLAAKAMQPDPGLTVLEQIVQAQRDKIDTLQAELHQSRTHSTKLQIEAASTGTEESKAKAALYTKGLDIVDGIAGAVVKKMAEDAAAGAAGGKVISGLVATELKNKIAARLAAT